MSQFLQTLHWAGLHVTQLQTVSLHVGWSCVFGCG